MQKKKKTEINCDKAMYAMNSILKSIYVSTFGYLSNP